MARSPSKQQLPAPLYLAASYVFFLGLPTLICVIIGLSHPGILTVLHYMVATAYALTAIMMLMEARVAIPRRRAKRAHTEALPEMPLTTVIVSAYLPNEQDLIAETIVRLTTQMHVPSYKLQIILAYNTPDDLPVEETLASFGQLNASFLPLRVVGSRSKAENILAALPHARGEMTVLLDADHHPHPDAFERAYRWLESGYDVVQGRCVVRNQRQNLLTRLVSVEFEQIYGISHTGRSLSVDTAIFGGTNGYWRTSVLKEIGMDSRMLTEDIDSSIRALLGGYRLIHDRSVISTELATATMRSWWTQRLRWAQGWFQVTLRHQVSIWRCEHLNRRTKWYWTYMLTWRELFPLLSLQIFALLIAALVIGQPVNWVRNWYLAGTTVITLASGPLVAMATYRIALWRTKKSLRAWFVIFALTSLVYTTMKNMVAMVAMLREFRGESPWVVTARQAAESKAKATADIRYHEKVGADA
ncbi:MAG TPA: glycosyltransferase family 2 protein [Actinomycetota bacterium]